MSRQKIKSRHYESLNKPFFAFPVDTIKSRKMNGLPVHARWLYAVLMTRFNRQKEKIRNPFPFTYTELEDITGFQPRRIYACIKALEEADIITVTHGGKNNPSLYLPNMEHL